MREFLKPEFFDIFGIPTFIFVIVLSYWELKTGAVLPRFIMVILFTLGVLGLATDIYNVYKSFFSKK